jgi:hypothetical protein
MVAHVAARFQAQDELRISYDGSMFKPHPWLEAFEREQSRKEPPDYRRNLRLYEAMYEHARRLGVLPPADPLEGIEHKIHLAKALNSVRYDIGAGGPRTG